MAFTANKSNGVEVLKVLEKNYLINSMINTVQTGRSYITYLQVGINWNVDKEDAKNFTKTYFSDIPQDLISSIGDKKEQIYYKIII